MKRFAAVLFLLSTAFFLLPIWGHATPSTWLRIYGTKNEERACCFQQTADGGFVMGGTVYFSGQADFWVVRLDPAGSILWQKTFGGNASDEATSLQQTTDGGFILAGRTFSFGGNAAWVIKLDAAGSLQWQKALGESASGGDLRSVQQTADSGYILAGVLCGQSCDYWIVKLDSSGTIQWQRAFNENGDDHFATSIQQTQEGGYVVSGESYSFATGFFATLILKLDPQGNIEWTKNVSSSGVDFILSTVRQTLEGGYILSGWIASPIPPDLWDGNLLVAKMDSLGNIEWQKVYTNGSPDEYAFDVHQTSDGGYAVAAAGGGARILKLDGFGSIQWQRGFGAVAESFTSVKETTDGGYAVAGNLDGPSDLLVVRLGPNGETAPSCNDVIPLNVMDFADSITTNPVVSQTVPGAVSTNSTGASTVTVATMSETVFCDDFEDGILSPDWNFSPGQWSEKDGSLVGKAQGKQLAIARPAFDGCSRCSISAPISSDGDKKGFVSLIGWYKDPRNYVELRMKVDPVNVLVLYQIVDGRIAATTKSHVYISPVGFSNLHLTFDGKTFRVFVYSSLILVLEKAKGSKPFGTVGFREKRTTGAFRSIFVTN